MSTVVADCDLLNFTLVHLKLGAEVQALLHDCRRCLITLDQVYRKEAQAPLRAALDALIGAKGCELVAHPDGRKLEKRQLKIVQQVHHLAEKRYRLTSNNDRGLLAEAQLRDAPLFTEDGPLRALAAARGQTTFDARDLVTLLFELRRIDDARRDALLGAVDARAKQRRRADTGGPDERASVAAQLCSLSADEEDEPAEASAGEACLTAPPAPSPAPADPPASG